LDVGDPEGVGIRVQMLGVKGVGVSDSVFGKGSGDVPLDAHKGVIRPEGIGPGEDRVRKRKVECSHDVSPDQIDGAGAFSDQAAASRDSRLIAEDEAMFSEVRFHVANVRGGRPTRRGPGVRVEIEIAEQHMRSEVRERNVHECLKSSGVSDIIIKIDHSKM